MKYTPDYSVLKPELATLSSGRQVALFHSDATQLLKLDITFPVGTMHQSRPLSAPAAGYLAIESGAGRSSQQVARFLDFHGVNMERSADVNSTYLTLYFPSRHAPEVLPFVADVLAAPEFSEQDLAVYSSQRKQQLLTSLQKTTTVARRYYYGQLFGAAHPHGSFALPEDYDNLGIDDVREFYSSRCPLSSARIMLAGACDDSILKIIENTPLGTAPTLPPSDVLPHVGATPRMGVVNRLAVPGSVQSTIRIGRIVPLEWDSQQYADFCVLNAILGGYFGSRLMTNIREEKGYTYGIYSQSNILHGSRIFFISADVDAAFADKAVDEVNAELQRLIAEPVPRQELDLVRQVLVGDFMRSIDGIFEVSERYNAMIGKHIDETFTRNFFRSIEEVTPERLQELAKATLNPAEMLQIISGPSK